MGALAQLDPTPAISRAVTNVVQPIEKTVTQNLAQLDKDLSLSQNALPILGTAALAASGLIPGIPGVVGGATGAGA